MALRARGQNAARQNTYGFFGYRSQILHRKPAEIVRYRPREAKRDRSVADGPPPEAIANRIARPVGAPSCHALLRARTALIARHSDRQLELQDWVLLQI